MSLETRLNEINNKLQEFQKNIERIFEQLVNQLETPEIKDKFQHFKEVEINKISQNISHTIKVIDSPIYVGLLGRYSHGKTALLNTFFSIDQEYALPEGEGMVTSKITEVAFDSKVSSPVCLEVLRDGSENRINIETLKASVSKKAIDRDAEMVDFYSIKLPAREKFSELFENKKIHLIDMPGLGGVYFKDTEKTRKYIENIDMLIVVIKITKIEEASSWIEQFINKNNLSIPIIPVLTFFDKWEEGDIFFDCKNEEEVIVKAKSLIKEKLPSLSRYEVRTMAVSSITKLNVSELRECVLSFIEESNFIISRINKETPEVFRRKIIRLSQLLDQVSRDIEKSLEKLKKEIDTLIPQRKFESFKESFKKQKDKRISESKKSISNSVKSINSEFQVRVRDIIQLKDYNEITNFINRIEQELNLTRFKELSAEIKSLLDSFKIVLIDEVKNYIDKLEISTFKKDKLRQSALNEIENFDFDFELDTLIEYKAPEIVKERIREFINKGIDIISETLLNPQLIFLFPVVIILLFLRNFWLLDKLGISSNLIDPMLFFVFAGFLLSVFFRGSKQRFNEAKIEIFNSLSSSFDRQKYTDNYCQIFVKYVDEMLKKIDEELEEITNPYIKDTKKISSEMSNFKGEVQTINKYIKQEIEKLETEQA